MQIQNGYGALEEKSLVEIAHEVGVSPYQVPARHPFCRQAEITRAGPLPDADAPRFQNTIVRAYQFDINDAAVSIGRMLAAIGQVYLKPYVLTQCVARPVQMQIDLLLWIVRMELLQLLLYPLPQGVAQGHPGQKESEHQCRGYQ